MWRRVDAYPGVATGSVLLDPETGGFLQVGELRRVDPFELLKLAKEFGGPGAVERIADLDIRFSLELGAL